jgi:predicted dehydrogenase
MPQSAHAQPATVAVIGAGRWARELARSARAAAPDAALVMHSTAHGDALREWLAGEGAVPDTRVTDDFDALAAARPAAVIVANAARDHAGAIEWALDRAIPALVEKPFTDSLADTRRLVDRARASGRRLYAAHVLRFAEYLPAFALRIGALRGDLAIDWVDPAQEIRHGERKRFDAGVPVYLDCLPHVVSVLETLCPGDEPQLLSLDCERGGARVRLEVAIGARRCAVVLERNGAERRRSIALSGADEVVLDFSREPGIVRAGGAVQDADPAWAARPRPLVAMIDAFLRAASGGPEDPRLDAMLAVRAAGLIDRVEPLYNSRRRQWLDGALAARGPGDPDVAYALTEIQKSGGMTAVSRG